MQCPTCTRLEAACDNAWSQYRKARSRLATKRHTYAAQQAFIDASAAVARTQNRLSDHQELDARNARNLVFRRQA